MLDQLENEGIPLNLSYMLALQLQMHVSNAQILPKDEQERLFMSAYLLDAMCSQHQFPGIGWTWTSSDDVVNIYFKLISK